MKCSSCDYFYNEGCCLCKTGLNVDFNCAHIVQQLSDADQRHWKCASCRMKLTSSGAAVGSKSVTLEVVLTEIQELKSQLAGMSAAVGDVRTIKEDINHLKTSGNQAEGYLRSAVSNVNEEVQQLSRKIGPILNELGLIKTHISESVQAMKNEIVSDLNGKLCELDSKVCLVGGNVWKEARSIQHEFGLAYAVLLGKFSEIDLNQLDIKASLIQNEINYFKAQILSYVQAIMSDISDLKAEIDLNVHQISRMAMDFNWTYEPMATATSGIKNKVDTFERQVLASEQETKKAIANLRTIQRLSMTKTTELADQLIKTMKQLKFEAQSIQNEINSNKTEIISKTKILKKEIADVKIKDSVISRKKYLKYNESPWAQLGTDVQKQAIAIQEKATDFKTGVSKTEQEINELRNSEIGKLTDKILSSVDIQHLHLKANSIENELHFINTYITTIDQEMKKEISNLNVARGFSNVNITTLERKITEMEINASSIDNKFVIIKTKISTSERALIKEINELRTCPSSLETDINEIVELAVKIDIKQNDNQQHLESSVSADVFKSGDVIALNNVSTFGEGVVSTEQGGVKTKKPDYGTMNQTIGDVTFERDQTKESEETKQVIGSVADQTTEEEKTSQTKDGGMTALTRTAKYEGLMSQVDDENGSTKIEEGQVTTETTEAEVTNQVKKAGVRPRIKAYRDSSHKRDKVDAEG